MNPTKIAISIPKEELKNFIIDILSEVKNKNLKSPDNCSYPQELFTVQEVARKLKINKNLIYKLIKKGHIKALKLGSLKVTSKELERFINYAEGKDFSDLDNIKNL